MRKFDGYSTTAAETEGYVNERGHRVLELIRHGTQYEVHGRLFAPAVDQLLAADHSVFFSNWTQDGATDTYWVLTDQQGTVRDLVERQGSDNYWRQHVDYDTFGVPSFYSGVAQDVGALYAGREYDFYTDLYYNRARWYDPAMQRFISEDPMGFAGGDPNLYRYCGNSPTNATDPSGQFIVSGTILAIAGISLALGGAGTASLYHAADQYDAANAIMAIPNAEMTQADMAQYRDLTNSARMWHATGEVAGVTALAVAGGPVVNGLGGLYVGTMGGIFGTWGSGLATASLVGGSGYLIGRDAIGIARDWNQMDNIERFHRVGLLVGPMVGGMTSGYLTRSWATLGYQRGLAGGQYVRGAAAGVMSSALRGTSRLVGGRASRATFQRGTTVGDLRSAGIKDAHHIIQDAAVRDIPGYDTNLAPGRQLTGPSTAKGTPHYEATQVQRQPGGGTYAAERRIAYKALRRSGLSVAEARLAIQEADYYFRSLGVGPSTPTRIPGNR